MEPYKTTVITVDGRDYDRLAIKTHLITIDDDLVELVRKYVVPHLRPDDYIFISEQIVAITQGRIILIRDIKPSRFARFLSKRIGVHFGTKDFRGFGLGTPPAMELALQEVGFLRLFLGATVAAITKPLGIKGMFYRIVGTKAKAIDCPASYTLWPYHQYAKLAPLAPHTVAYDIAQETDHETVIIDANYIGVSVLGKSSKKISDDFAEKVFRDNPLGQGDEQTPLSIVRKSAMINEIISDSMHQKADKNQSIISYDDYDYSDFWRGRKYEDRADKIAVARLLSHVEDSHDKLIDIGAGRGRMTPLYETKWKEFTLLDPSKHQLSDAKKEINNFKKAKFIIGTAEHIPLPNESFDTALCMRTFHYVPRPIFAIREICRILKPGGYLILEIPNKLHIKNRLVGILQKSRDTIHSDDPISKTTRGEGIFVNHSPRTISLLLEMNNFEILETLSVSNFRSAHIKKIIPVSLLLMLEKLAQRPLAPLWFGPSIYFLAKKKKV